LPIKYLWPIIQDIISPDFNGNLSVLGIIPKNSNALTSRKLLCKIKKETAMLEIIGVNRKYMSG